MMVFLLSVVLILSYSTDSAAFDYYQLVLQWPPSVCKVPNQPPCRINPPHEFTIHGYWAELYSGAPIPPPGESNYWSKTRLRKALSETTMTSLHTTWPQLLTTRNKNNPDFQFWLDEWNKHGINSGLEPGVYFTRASQLANSLNVEALLTRGGLAPGKTFTAAKIQQAAGGANNLKPNLHCWADTKNNRRALLEIRYCTNLNGQPIACPTVSWSSCGGSANSQVFIYA